FLMRDARKHTRVGDLVSVQVQNGQHYTIGGRIEEFIRMPTGGERAGFGLTVADDGRDNQVGIVESCPERVTQRVAQFTALLNRTGRFRRYVARYPAGEGEPPEHLLDPLFVLRDVRINLAVGALKP